MADTNKTVFTTKLIDLDRLTQFWNEAKGYVLAAVAAEMQLREAADSALDGKISANTTAIGVLNDTTVPGLQNAINTERGRVDGLVNTTIPGINAEINTLKNTTIPGVQETLETAINDERERIDTLEDTTIPNLNTAITNITKAGGAIDTKIAALNPDSNSNTSKYATNVQVVNGKIVVDYLDLPEGVDWQPAINDAKDDAIEAAADALAAHAAAKVSADANAGGIHVTAADREKWDGATDKIDTFLAGADLTDHLFDTLKEIQGYIDTDGNAADILVGRVDDLEDRASNLEAEDVKINGRIDALTQTVTTNKNNIEKAVTDLDTAYKAKDEELAGLINGVSGRVTTLEAVTIPALEAADEALDGKITALTNTVSANKSSIEKAVTDLDAACKLADQELSGRLDTLETANTANTTAHAGFTSSIEAIQALLNGMTLATDDEVKNIVKTTMPPKIQ